MQAERRRLILQLDQINSRSPLGTSNTREAGTDIQIASSPFPGSDALTVDVLLKEMLKRDGGFSRSWCFSDGLDGGTLEDSNKIDGRVSSGRCDHIDDHMICADAVLQKIQVSCANRALCIGPFVCKIHACNIMKLNMHCGLPILAHYPPFLRGPTRGREC
jgi:hypothetical protein